MLRQSLIFSVALAANITLSCILITAQQNNAPQPPNAASQTNSSPRPQQAQPADNRQGEANALRDIAADIRAINQRQTKEEQERADAKSDYWGQVFAPSVLSQWTLAFFALIAAGVAVKTLRAIEAEVGITRQTLAVTHQKERAYIDMSHYPPGLIVDAFSGTSSDDPVSKTRVRVSIGTKNSGNTPGTVTARLIQLLFTAKPLPLAPPYHTPDIETLRIPLMKDGTVKTTRVWNVPDDELKRARTEPAANFYVIGYVDYIDQFGLRHRAGYARIYDPRATERHQFYGHEGNSVVHVPDPVAVENNLPFVTEMSYNYDRPRTKGEGNDWD